VVFRTGGDQVANLRGFFVRPHEARPKISAAMSANPHLNRVRALHRKKQREEQGLFLVQGRKLVRELLGSRFRVDSIHATREAAETMGLRDAIISPAHDLERMGTFEHGNEVIAVVHVADEVPVRLPAANELVLALDGINDPGNLGTVLRIADQFGVKQVWCSEGSVEMYNPKCVQASMGSLFRVAVSSGDLPKALRDAITAKANVYKAEASGTDVFTVELQRPAVLVLGSESHGLSEEVERVGGTSIAIPGSGGAESLNVAAAAAALCMEFARRIIQK